VAGGDDRARTLRAIDGLWRDRTDIGDSSEYVRRLRRNRKHYPMADVRFFDAATPP
jgi:hypothetical protein